MRKLGLTSWVFRAAGSVFRAEGPPHRIWDIWGSYCNMPKAIFYLLKGDFRGLE